MFFAGWSLVATIVLVASAVAPVGATSRLPGPLREVLGRFGVAPDTVEQFTELFLMAALPDDPATSETTDASIAARMERARQEDTIADANDALFGDPNVRLGMWKASAFLRDYGTALFLTAPYDDRRTPVFLVHGINGSPRDLAALVAQFRTSRYQPIVFYYPTGMPLSDASRELGARMQQFLRRHPTDSFAVVGHSMGGLVAKGMLDQFDAARVFPGWKALVGISCPWSGVPAAAQAYRLPVHPRSWDDLAPASRFVQDINDTPFPRRLAFYMFFGARGGRSPLSVLGNNDGRVSVDSMMDTPLAKAAQDTFGFYEDHASILGAPRVFERLQMVLDHEFGSPRVDRPSVLTADSTS
jgi:pimeloyl-ACP methyl ester carboxylesterase